MISGQVLPSDWSDEPMSRSMSQLSVAVTLPVSGSGTSSMHSTVTSSGQPVISGGVSSLTVVDSVAELLPGSGSVLMDELTVAVLEISSTQYSGQPAVALIRISSLVPLATMPRSKVLLPG